MQGEMTRGRSQVIWRFTPSAIFRYNDDNAWCMVTDVTMHKTKELEGVLADALADRLSYWNAIGLSGFPDPRTQPHKYIVGEPYWVRYDIWPTILVCENCKRIHWWGSVSRLKSTNDHLRCRSCGHIDDVLKQIPFAYVCECGNLETVYIPKCPTNAEHPVGFEDKRTFQDSYWYCQICKSRITQGSRAGLGVRACQCGKAMRGTTLIDPRVYYSQTIALVDIQPDALGVWKLNDNFANMLLGALLRIPSHNEKDIQNLSRFKSSKGELSAELQAMKEILLEKGVSAEKVDAMVKESALKASADPWVKYVEELSPCREYISGFDATNCRQTIEYVFVRDEPSAVSISLKTLIEEAELRGDNESRDQLLSDRQLCESLGLVNIAVVQELPILLAGIGYSRHFAGPIDFDGTSNKTKLRSYKTDDEGKIPIYAARNTTEALLFELDPWRIAAFLQVNHVIEIPKEALSSVHVLRSWLLNISGKLHETGESHMQLLSFEKERGDAVDLPSAMIFGVLHTVSHTLMATAHQYVGIDQDALAEYLFPSHTACLLYASSHVKFTLGGIDAVFRANLSQWIGTARDFANSCSFDPVCSQSGGACVACLYTKFGCNYFNRSLSRAFLFGGHVKGIATNLFGYWSHKVTDETRNLREIVANQ